MTATTSTPPNVPVWDDGHGPTLPVLEGDHTANACVIGLGGSGLTCIEEILSLGGSVIGIDAVSLTAGAAGRNGGLLVSGTADYHHDLVGQVGRDRAVAITRLTVDEMERLAEQAPDAVRETGSIRLGDTDEEYADCLRQMHAMVADGFEVTAYDGPLGRGIHVAGDHAFDPVMRGRALAAAVRKSGAALYGRSPAVEFGEGFVRSPNGRVHCDAVFVCVDGGLERLLPELVGTVRTARLQMLATEPTDEIRLHCPMSNRYGFDYWQQLPDGRIALGGGRDRAMDEEWTADATPTPRIQAYLDSLLRDRLRVTAAVTHRWAAIVSYTTTGLPVVGEVRPGVWVAGGYSGTGNLMGALSGRAIVRAAFDEPSPYDVLLSPLLQGRP